MATVANMMMGVSVRRIGNDVLASPRAFSIGAPIEGRADTAMIGAAANFPRPHGVLVIPGPTRMTIYVTFSPHLPESSPPKDTATEEVAQRNAQWLGTLGARAPLAIDTEVVLAGTQEVDDPRDSGAWKLSPGVFLRVRNQGGRTPVSQRRFGN